jgi:hypothetical protein
MDFYLKNKFEAKRSRANRIASRQDFQKRILAPGIAAFALASSSPGRFISG